MSSLDINDMDQIVRSEGLGKEFRYLWIISKYVSFPSNHEPYELESPVIMDGIRLNRWMLKLVPPTTTKARLLLTSVSKVKNAKMFVCIDFLDNKDVVFVPPKRNGNAMRLIGDGVGDPQKGFPDIVYDLMYNMNDHLDTLLHNGNLRILLRMWNLELESTVTVSGTELGRPPSLGHNLNSLLSLGTFSDVKICAGSTSFPAHKALLAARSDVFRTMFQAPMAEAEKNCVKISGFSLAVVKGMLEHIYTDSTEIKAENAGQFLQIADLYNLETLKYDAEMVLKKNLTVSNAVDAFLYSNLYKSQTLKSVSRDFIVRNKRRIVSSPEFEKLTKEEIVELLGGKSEKISRK